MHYGRMKSGRRIVDDEPYIHFVTFSVYRRRRLFSLDQPKRILLGVLNDELASFDARCVGFVVMPDHVHALIWLPTTGNLSNFMHGWKRKSSFHIRNWYREHANRYVEGFGEGVRFWQPKYYPFEIYSRRKIEEKLRYMHENPVRAGLVKRAADWPWSSARWYELGKSVGVPITWVE